jgi:anti-sigma regulatory factor (Ser/Thr protein kinase)
MGAGFPGRPLARSPCGRALGSGGAAGGCGRGDAGTAGVAAGESATIAGRPERVAVARAFAAAVLGRQHPAGETAVLLVSELVTNSVRHSASGLPGRTVTVTVLSSGEVTRVQVTDRSGTTVPALRPGAAGLAGGGRGLYLVDSLAARWGFEQDGDRTTTWFELQHG